MAVKNPYGTGVQIKVPAEQFQAFNHQLREVEDQSFATIANTDPGRALRLVVPLMLQATQDAFPEDTPVEVTARYKDGRRVETQMESGEAIRQLLGEKTVRQILLGGVLDGEGETVMVTVKSESMKPRKLGRRPRRVTRVQAAFEVNKEEIRRYLTELLPGEKEAVPSTPQWLMTCQAGHLAILDHIAQDTQGQDFCTLVEHDSPAAFNVLLTIELAMATQEGAFTCELDGVEKTISRQTEGAQYEERVQEMITLRAQKLLEQTGTVDIIMQVNQGEEPLGRIQFSVRRDQFN